MKVRGVEIEDGVYEKASKRLIELSEGWESGLGNGEISLGFALHLNGNNKASSVPYCHAWVPRGSYADYYILATCHSKQRSKGICTPEAHEALILWLARDSIFSEYFINRDDDDSLLRGGALLLCGGKEGLTRDQAMWVCKALRYAIESGQAADVWYHLYKGGINPMIALLVATDVRKTDGATFGFTGKLKHNSVFGNDYDGNSKAELYDPAELLDPKFNPHAMNTGQLFFSQKPKNKGELPFQKFCEPRKVSDGWGGKVAVEAANKDDFIARVKEWQDSLGKPVAAKKKPGRDTVYSEIDM